jgi:radical SAM superfamily enzyme
VLSGLKKKIFLNQIKRAIELTHQQGIDVELFTQFGLPHENLEDAMMTLEFLKDNKVPIRGNSNSQQTQIYFGTELQHHYKKYGFPLAKRLLIFLSATSIKHPAYHRLRSNQSHLGKEF